MINILCPRIVALNLSDREKAKSQRSSEPSRPAAADQQRVDRYQYSICKKTVA